MTKPRLLIAVHVYPDGGGISSIVENYVAELSPRYDVHVAVVEVRPGWERLKVPAGNFHRLGYTNAINPLLFPTSVLHSLRVGGQLRRLVRRLAPAALITQDGLHLAVPSVLATAATPTRLAIMDHGTLTNVHEPGWAPMLRARLGGVKGNVFALGFALDTPYRALRWRIGGRFADRLWFTGTELEPYFGRWRERVERYRQTVPADFTPASARERAHARAALGLPADGHVFNSVGRLDGEKGLDSVIDALDDDGVRRLPFTLAIAGDGTLEEWLAREVELRDLGGKVKLLGRLAREEVAQLQAASDAHLYAGTFSCGVSICLLEAMAAGVAPIASDQPTAQRQLIGDAGWVFEAGNVAELRAALVAAGSMSAEELHAVGAAARNAVHDQPDPSIPELIDRLVNYRA